MITRSKKADGFLNQVLTTYELLNLRQGKIKTPQNSFNLRHVKNGYHPSSNYRIENFQC